MTTCSVLPSVPYDAVGPPNSIFLSRLNTQPTRCPVNASPLPSRTATHDSGPTWFATPWLGGTCTRETYRFVPAHREVKILMRLPDGRNVATRQAVHGSAPCARTEVTGCWLGTAADSPCLDDSSNGDGRRRPVQKHKRTQDWRAGPFRPSSPRGEPQIWGVSEAMSAIRVLRTRRENTVQQRDATLPGGNLNPGPGPRTWTRTC